MGWKTDLEELKQNNPPLADFASLTIQMRNTGDMAAGEAFEYAFGRDLAKLLLASKNDFQKMLAEE